MSKFHLSHTRKKQILTVTATLSLLASVGCLVYAILSRTLTPIVGFSALLSMFLLQLYFLVNQGAPSEADVQELTRPCVKNDASDLEKKDTSSLFDRFPTLSRIPTIAYVVLFFALCIALTVLSFTFCFSKPLTDPITVILSASDLLLLVLNAYLLSDFLSDSARRCRINTLLTVLFYFSLFLTVGCLFFEESLTLPRLLGILRVSVFLGPVLILLLPLYYLILLILGG